MGIAIGMAILLCLLIGSPLPIYSTIAEVGNDLKGPDAPAWIQAIGSIVAIAVAICIPIRLQNKRDKAELEIAMNKAKVVSFPLWHRVQQAHLFFRMVRKKIDAGSYTDFDSLNYLLECKPKSKIATEEQLLIISIHTPSAALALSECNDRLEDTLILFDEIYNALYKERGHLFVKNSNSSAWHNVWSKSLDRIIDLEKVLDIKNKEF